MARRKPKRPTESTKLVGVRLPRKLLLRVDAFAADDWCDRSTALRTLIEAGLSR
jgi:hypothetical protein